MKSVSLWNITPRNGILNLRNLYLVEAIEYLYKNTEYKILSNDIYSKSNDKCIIFLLNVYTSTKCTFLILVVKLTTCFCTMLKF